MPVSEEIKLAKSKKLNFYRVCIKEYVRGRPQRCFGISAHSKEEARRIFNKRVIIKKVTKNG